VLKIAVDSLKEAQSIMSSYSQLYISNYPVYSYRNDVNPIVMTLFREGDKRVFERKVSERNQIVWGHLENRGEVETAYEYANTVANVRQRLEIMGFSLDKVKKRVCEGIIERIEHLKSMRAYLSNSAASDLLRSHYLAEQSLLENTEFADWLSAYKNIIKRKLRSQGGSTHLRLAKRPLVTYILRNELMPDLVYKDPRCH